MPKLVNSNIKQVWDQALKAEWDGPPTLSTGLTLFQYNSGETIALKGSRSRSMLVLLKIPPSIFTKPREGIS